MFEYNKTKQTMDDFLVGHNLKSERPSYIKRSLIFFMLLLLILAGLIFGPLFYQGVKVVKSVSAIDNSANFLMESIDKGDWLGASNQLSQVSVQMSQIRQALANIGVLYYIPQVKKTIDSSIQLIAVGQELVVGYQEVFELLDYSVGDLEFERLLISFSSKDQRDQLFRVISQNKQDFFAIQKRVDQARQELELLNTGDLSGAFKDKIILAEKLIAQAVGNTEIGLPLAINSPELLGYEGEKTYLLVFQNNMEIRPTGGFIGSYGLVTLLDGEIINLFTDDIYNLDKLSEGKMNILAPKPMQIYNNQKNWFMRDANWSPDWPTSAQQILWFFAEERKNAGLPEIAVDGVVAINPELISDLLAIVGPAMAEGVLFKADNFAQDLEFFVEFDYADRGIAKENRKDVIGVIAKQIVDSLYGLPKGDLLKVWLAFKHNIDSKGILVYLVDQELQNYFDQRNWSGQMQNFDGDYLMVVDANLGALKTDQVMLRSISRRLSIDEQGEMIADLEIIYNHQGQSLTDFITRYRTYTRIYVPTDSWFIEAKIIDANGREQYLNLQEDDVISEELGKKYLATFLVVEPSQSKTLAIRYRLPQIIKEKYNLGLYKLLVQKQPGTSGHDLKITLDFNQTIKSYHADNIAERFFKNQISWLDNLTIDRQYIIRF